MLNSQYVRFYELLIDANADEGNMNTYVVYSDPEDMQKSYNDAMQMKYWNFSSCRE
jgi:hypothetical protein